MAAKTRGGGGGDNTSRKKKHEPPPKPIHEQDRHICGLICVCQLTFVLSSVSLVYLSVAIYLPGYRAFNAAIETVPIMCQTINSTVSNNCEWASCGEWCLTKPSGNCPQYLVTVRQNGTDIRVENCTRLTIAYCPQASAVQQILITIIHPEYLSCIISLSVYCNQSREVVKPRMCTSRTNKTNTSPYMQHI